MYFSFHTHTLFQKQIQTIWGQAVSDWDISVFVSEGGVETTIVTFFYFLCSFLVFTFLNNNALKNICHQVHVTHHYDRYYFTITQSQLH